jgi:hypothetical protein
MAGALCSCDCVFHTTQNLICYNLGMSATKASKVTRKKVLTVAQLDAAFARVDKMPVKNAKAAAKWDPVKATR